MMEVQVWSWVVWLVVGLAVCGFVAVCWVVAGWCERLSDWRRGRERGIDPPWWWKPWLSRRVEDELCPCGKPIDHTEFCYDAPPPLPPERTWEQMTSHQLPLGPPPVWIHDWSNPDDVIGIQPALAELRERRAPWWEVQHRAAYESMGFDFPSGLMTRIREYTVRLGH